MLSKKNNRKIKTVRLTKKNIGNPKTIFFKKLNVNQKQAFIREANKNNSPYSLVNFYKPSKTNFSGFEKYLTKPGFTEQITDNLKDWNYFETKDSYDLMGDNINYHLFHCKLNNNQGCDLVVIPGYTAKSCHFMFARFLLMLKIINEMNKKNKYNKINNFKVIPYDNVYVINFDGAKEIMKKNKEKRGLFDETITQHTLDIMLNLGIKNCNIFAKSAGAGIGLGIMNSVIVKGAMLFCPGGDKLLFSTYLKTVKPGVMQKPIYIFWSLNDNKIPIKQGYTMIETANKRKPKYSMIKLIEINTNDSLDDTNHRIHLQAIPYLMSKNFRNITY